MATTRKRAAADDAPAAQSSDAGGSGGAGAGDNVWLAGLGALAQAQAQGTKAFDALDAASKEAVLKAAAAAEARGWKTAQEKNEEYKKLLAERGMKIHKPSPKLEADMRQVGATMQADWLKLAGADGAAIVDAYKQK